MTLTLKERLILLQILPITGSFVAIKAIRELREELAPDEKEAKAMDVLENKETGQITWDSTKDVGKDFDFSEMMFEIIKVKLKEMDENEELTLDHEKLYSIFAE